ncbi:MAG: DUF3604 domain-containing protein [Acidobacteria bacterium]|nr:DUF3604 domain-containing protein [Acidobacteriota bacterium]
MTTLLPALCIFLLAAPAIAGPLGLRIEFGLRDSEPTAWDGEIQAKGGTVLRVEGLRFQDADAITGPASWKASTRLTVYWDARYPRIPHPMMPPVQRLVANGVLAWLRLPESGGSVSVTTRQGSFELAGDALRPFASSRHLGGSVVVQALPWVEAVAEPGSRQDDAAELCVRKGGEAWVTWLGYENSADQVLAARFAGGKWSEPEIVSGERGACFGPQVAEDSSGRLWVVWSARDGEQWKLEARWRGPEGWSPPQALSNSGIAKHHRLARDSNGRLWVAWQATMPGGRNRILARRLDNDRWSEPLTVSEGAGNHWEPDLAADSKGAMWFVWDGYDLGSYDIYVRQWREGRLEEVRRITQSSRFQAHASAVCDRQDRLWVGWDEGEVNWGKDWSSFRYPPVGGNGLYRERRVQLAVVDGGPIRRPVEDLDSVIPPRFKQFVQMPRLSVDQQGRVWAALRVLTDAGVLTSNNWGTNARWQVLLTYYEGNRWAEPLWMPSSTGRNNSRAALAFDEAGNAHLAWSSDGRPFRAQQPPARLKYQVFATSFTPPAAKGAATALAAYADDDMPAPVVHARETEDLERIRSYRLNWRGKQLRILRGDLHRHTDISPDGAGDGSLADLYRYSIDAAGLDFVMPADHNYGGQEFNWWRTEKAADLYFAAGRFVPMYGYERSVPYPNGHRNLVFPQRGNNLLRIAPEEAKGAVNSGPLVFPLAREKGGIAIPHTPATSQGTDWRDVDPQVQPVVELYQGLHSSYEYEGAPRASKEELSLPMHGAYEKAGWVSTAWGKGIRIGVIGSSDHIATHESFACVLTEEFTRAGILDAMRRRHTYAATDNIVLDVRVADSIMGDEMRADKPLPFEVFASGTTPIRRVDVITNGKVVYSSSPMTERTKFTYMPAAVQGETWTYVRLEQTNGALAWSSPIWVDYRR